MPPRECPMCTSTMRLVQREMGNTVPGSTGQTTIVTEWVCPDCDYFEEADDEDE